MHQRFATWRSTVRMEFNMVQARIFALSLVAAIVLSRWERTTALPTPTTW